MKKASKNTTEQYPLIGGGEMGKLMRSKDWSNTSIGPIESWSESLKLVISLILGSKFGMFLFWGQEHICFYNDAYRPSLGNAGKHPKALGLPGKEVWPEIWHIIGPQIEQVMTTGVATWNENHLVPIYRNGILDEVYWTYTYSPVRDSNGTICGVLVVETETTKQVFAERRMKVLRDLAVEVNIASSIENVAEITMQILKKDQNDIAFALIYLKNENSNDFSLIAHMGLPNNSRARVSTINANDKNTWPIKKPLETCTKIAIKNIQKYFGEIKTVSNSEPIKNAFICPLIAPNQDKPFGILITGVNPRRIPESEFIHFHDLLSSQVSTAISKFITHEQEKKQIETERRRLYNLFMQTPAFIAVVKGKNHIFELQNEEYKKLVGFRNIIGKPVAKALPEVVKQGFINLLDTVYTTGKPFYGSETKVLLQRGENAPLEERFVNFVYHPIVEADGAVSGIFVHGVDITEQIQARKEIEQARATADSSEKQLRLITNSLPAFISYIDKTERYQYVNHAYEEWYGLSEKQIVGKTLKEIAELTYTKNKKIIKTVLQGEPISFETTITNSRNTIKHVEINYIPDINPNGKVRGFVVLAHDITSRKLIENSLSESEERLRLALSAGSIGVWDWDIINNKLSWTESVYNIYGVDPKTFKLNFENYQTMIHPEDNEKRKKAIKYALEGKAPYTISFRIVRPNGEIRWITTSATITRDTKGHAIRMIGATSDITEQKKLEEDKNDFISIATHELKTPVTSLKAYAEVLQKKFSRAGDNLSATHMGKMNAQLDKLTSLISDLLDATKIESGKLYMHEDSFDFDELVSEIVEELQRTTDKHTLSVKGKTKKNITADRERTGQVLTNLISNAIKYSPHTDNIIIKSTANKKEVQVCVEDFGVGIPKSKQSRLFERFYRVSGPQDNTFPGLGLGLYISSEIVKRQGGRIWVESTLGKGSAFCFSLPIKATVTNEKNTLIEEEIKHS